MVRRLIEPGGGAVHTAEWAAAMGCNVRIAGNGVGSDPLGELALEWLRGFARIDTSRVSSRKGSPTPIADVAIGSAGERRMQCVGFKDASMTPITRELLAGVDVVALNLYDEWPAPEFLQLASVATEMGIAMVLTDVVGPYADAGLQPTVVTISADALRTSIGTLDIGATVSELHSGFDADTVVTDGENPIWCLGRDGSDFIIEPPSTRAVNTTGAGDAFRAGIAIGVARGWPLERSVRLAATLGAAQSERSTSPRAAEASTRVERLAQSLSIQRRSEQPCRSRGHNRKGYSC